MNRIRCPGYVRTQDSRRYCCQRFETNPRIYRTPIWEMSGLSTLFDFDRPVSTSLILPEISTRKIPDRCRNYYCSSDRLIQCCYIVRRWHLPRPKVHDQFPNGSLTASMRLKSDVNTSRYGIRHQLGFKEWSLTIEAGRHAHVIAA